MLRIKVVQEGRIAVMEREVKAQSDLRTVVVAGCSSGVGKTTVAETITAFLARQCRTAAAKITVTHGDRGCPHGGKGCNVCTSLGGDFQIVVSDSIISQPGTDTSRLQAAGGNPVVWAITRDIALAQAWQGIKAHLSDVDWVVVESNTLTVHIKPTITMMVVDPSVSRKIWKPSAERLIATADYVVFNDRGSNANREALLGEVNLSRNGLTNVIKVSHPQEVAAYLPLIQDFQTKSIPA